MEFLTLVFVATAASPWWQDLILWLTVGAGGGFIARLPNIIAAAKGHASSHGGARSVVHYEDTAALLKHEALLEELWRLGVPAAVVGSDGRPIIANDALARLLGYGPAALTSMSFSDFSIPDSNQDEDLRQWSRLVAGQQESYELPLKSWRHANGKTISGRVVVATVRGATWGPARQMVALAMIFDRTAEIEEQARRVAAETAAMTLQWQMSGALPKLPAPTTEGDE